MSSKREWYVRFTLLAAIAMLMFTMLGSVSQAKGSDPNKNPASHINSTNAQTISGNPLSITINDDTSTAIDFAGRGNQYYGGNAEGAYVWWNGAVYGPQQVPAGNTVNAWVPVSNVLTGNGSRIAPWTVTTVVNTGNGLQLTQIVQYINGNAFANYRFQVVAAGAWTLFHAADLYTAGSDSGLPYYDPATGDIGGRSSNPADPFYQFFRPVTAASKYMEAGYRVIWDAIGDNTAPGPGFNNTVDNTDIDNGAGLQWDRSGNATIDDIVVFNFSPTLGTPTPTPQGGIATPTEVPDFPGRLVLRLRVDKDLTADAGGQLKFTVAAYNAGHGEARNAYANFPLDGNLQLVNASFTTPNGYVTGIYTDPAINAIGMSFGTLQSHELVSGTLTFKVADSALGAPLKFRVNGGWADNFNNGGKVVSNGVNFNVGDTASSTGTEARVQLADVAPAQKNPATSVNIVARNFIPGERLRFWLNTPDGVAGDSSIDYADETGLYEIDGLSYADLAAGSYSLVIHGDDSNVDYYAPFTRK